MATRREVLAAAAVTVSLPMLEAALGGLRSARAQTAPATEPSTRPASPPARGTGRASRMAPDEKPGWLTTKLKPTDVKDGEFADVEGHGILLARTGKDVTAISGKCTHMGGWLHAKAGEKIVTCPIHGGKFNLDGSLADPKTPPKKPLPNYAIRVNADGFVEVDPGTMPKPDDKEFKITLT